MNTVFYYDLTTRNAKSIIGTIIIHHPLCSLQIFFKIKNDSSLTERSFSMIVRLAQR